ncbi:MAG: hypothetical protein GH151_10935 [Bacteroidetes bacterium]|nr:hypothetical protein [Bacteroidota bacterium]
MSNNYNLGVDLSPIQVVVDEIRAVDVPNLGAAIIAGALTEKQKSLLGVGVHPGFSDYFNTMGHNVNPDATNWNVREEGNGECICNKYFADKPGYLYCRSGDLTGESGIATTSLKQSFSLKNGVTSINYESRVNFDWTADNGNNCGLGFHVISTAGLMSLDHLVDPVRYIVSIVVHDQVPTAFTSDGAIIQTTDLSAYISNGVDFTILVVISKTDVKFYVNGMIGATHATRVPDAVWYFAVGTTCKNDSVQYTRIEKIEIWGE